MLETRHTRHLAGVTAAAISSGVGGADGRSVDFGSNLERRAHMALQGLHQVDGPLMLPKTLRFSTLDCTSDTLKG